MLVTNKSFISIGLVGASFLISYVAFAQTTDLATTSAPKPTVATTSVINQQTQITLTPLVQERLINLAANMSNRIEAMETRLSKISARLDSRLNKMTEAGISTQAAAQQLASANQLLREVRGRLTTIDADVINAVTAESPAVKIIELQGSYRTMTTTLRNAHTELVATLILLKQATSTPAVKVEPAIDTE